MPITPKEAVLAETNGTDDEFMFKCRAIDAHLSDGGRTVDARDMGPMMRDRVARAYRDAGWMVQIVVDWRDGDYIQFEEP